MNLDVLTPSMWEMLRSLEYDQLRKFQMMMQPVEDEE